MDQINAIQKKREPVYIPPLKINDESKMSFHEKLNNQHKRERLKSMADSKD